MSGAVPVLGRGKYPVAEYVGQASTSLMDRLDAIAGEASWPSVTDAIWPGVTS